MKQRGSKYVVVRDGVLESENEFEDFLLGSFVFSPDSERLSNVAAHDKKWRVVVDGVPGPPFHKVNPLVFSPDSKHWAYVAERHYGDGVSDRVEVGDAILQVIVVDGVERRGPKSVMVLNGNESREYDHCFALAWSRDAQHWAYQATISGKTFVVVDGEAGAPYDDCTDFSFSADSRRWAYRARKGGRERIVIDGREQPEYEAICDFRFSPDSRRYAYRAVHGKWSFAVVNDSRGRPYDDIGRGVSFQFNPRTNQLFYVARRGQKALVVIEDQEGKEYDNLTPEPVFSADGKHYAYVAKRGEKTLMVVDGLESEEFDQLAVGNALGFDGSTLHTVSTRGGQIYRVSLHVDGD